MLKTALVILAFISPSFAEGLPKFELNAVKIEGLRSAGRVHEREAPPAAELFLPSSKAGYIQMTSSTKLKMDKEKGELTIVFPRVEFGGGTAEDKSHLFVRVLRETPTPVISWATVLCSGGNYLGYKGSTLNFPEQSGSFSVSETLALGAYPGRLIERTHPWLTDSLSDLKEVCSKAFLEKMKDARAETLPSKLGNFSFEFNSRKNTLKAKW